MDRRPDPPPLRTNDVRTVGIATALWALALVGCAVFWRPLDDAGRGWWLGTAVTGFALGFVGLWYLRRRAAAIARAARDDAPA